MLSKFRSIDLSSLSLREKIGQTALMQMSKLMNKDGLANYLSDNPIGNLWHFGNYAMTTANLTNIVGDELHDCEYYRKWMLSYGSMLKIPPLIGIDPPDSGFALDMPELVNAPTIGAADSPDISYAFGKLQAKITKSVGGNYNWAPVMDIPSRFNSIAIMRSISDELNKLCKLSGKMIEGVQDEGVVATIKHFPGTDEYEYRDPHFSPSCINTSLDKWENKQGMAFQKMIDGGVLSVMVGHTSFPAVDDTMINNTYIPSTLSKKVIGGLLKEKMNFNGIVITDSIDMAGVSTLFETKEELYIALLNAGNDILLNVSDDYIDIIERAIKDGRISEERVDDACRRILNVKKMIGLFNKSELTIMDENLRNEISSFNKTASEKAITLECDKNSSLPFNSEKIKNVAIICSAHVDRAFIALNHMKSLLESRGMNVSLQRRLSSDEEIKKIAEENDLIIYAGYIWPHEPIGPSGFYGEECETFFYAFSHGKEKSVGVSFGSSYIHYDYYSGAPVFVNAYSLSEESQEAFIKAIFGEIPFTGTMPYIAPGPRIQ